MHVWVALGAVIFFCNQALAASPRATWNQRAQEHNIPLFWVHDEDGSNTPGASELAYVWGMSTDASSDWLTATGLSDKAKAAVDKLNRGGALPPAPAEDAKRREWVTTELRQSVPALILTDARNESAEDKAFIKAMASVGRRLDALYLRQVGATELEALLPADDPASRTLFFRNHGPYCQSSLGEPEPQCNAIPTFPARLTGLYPTELQKKKGFCELLVKHPYARALSHPFSVIRGDIDAMKPVPYHIVFASEMDAVSAALKEAAAVLTDPKEAAMKAYLLAASQAFRDNQWPVADEPWIKTGGGASKWFVRIAPDEAYADPCSRKAVFSLTFGRMNTRSSEWQQTLEPFKQTMEELVAKMAGPPYKARQVSFKLPDFIDVILSAGDARLPSGATLGQSLPLFGKVAAEGRKRTLAMTNLYVDKDSAALAREQAESIFCAKTLDALGDDPTPKLMSTILHEASHNLGPIGYYQVNGQGLAQIFGPQLSMILSELHAQTMALYFADWLRTEGVISAKLADAAHLRDLLWAFDQIARGITTPEGKPKPYGVLSAIQVQAFLREGGLQWRAADKSSDGKRTGCLSVDAKKLEASIANLALNVSAIKASGDRKKADALTADAAGESPQAGIMATIGERMRQFPKTTFLFSLRVD